MVPQRTIWLSLALAGLAICTSASAQFFVPTSEPIQPPTDPELSLTLEAQLQSEMQAVEADATWGPFEEGREPNKQEQERNEAAGSLCDTLKEYLAALKDLRALGIQLAELSSDDPNRRLSEELATLTERINRVKRSIPSRPRPVPEEEMTAATKELETAQTEAAARADTLRERRERLEGATGRKEAAQRAMQEAQSALLEALSDYESRRAVASDDIERATADLRLRDVHIRASLAAAEQQRAGLEADRDGKLVGMMEQRIPLDRELIARLGELVSRLKQFQAFSETEKVKAMVDWLSSEPSASPYELAYWELRLAMMTALREVTGTLANSTLKDRFTADDHAELMDDLASQREMWETFVRSIHRRQADQKRDRYLEVDGLVSHWEQERERKRRLADTTFDERATIVARLDALRDQIRTKRKAIRQVQRQNPADEMAVKLSPQLAEYEERFDKEVGSIEQSLDELVGRLDDATTMIDRHVVALAQLRSRVYIAYLGVRDQQLWRYRWSKTVEEWGSEKRREVREKYWKELRAAREKVTSTEWWFMGAALLIAVILAVVGRQQLRQHARRLESRLTERLQGGSVAATLSDRFHIQVTDFLAATALPCWPLLCIWACVRLSPLDGRLAELAVAVLVAAFGANALIRTLFSQSKARFRLLPCSNVVARYYRRWFRAALALSVLLLPLPLVMLRLNVSYYTMSYLFTLYKICILAVALVFLARRQIVLKIVGRPEDLRYPWLLSAVSFLYPVGYLCVLALLMLTLAGYGALTNYLISGLVRSTVLIGAVALGWRYLRDLFDRVWQSLREPAEDSAPAATTTGETAESNPPVAVAPPTLRAADEDIGVGLVTTVLRWGVSMATAVMVLGYWGLSWVDLRGLMEATLVDAGVDGRPPVTVQRALAACLLVGVGWTFARALRRALQFRLASSLSQEDRGGWIAVGTLAQYLILLFALYFALYVLQIPLGALTVVLGTLGLGLGLGLQPLFANFFSGLVILFERHVKVGDTVVLDDGTLGEVTNISVRATTIKTPDNVDVVIPNGDFISGRVTNWTLDETRIRAKLPVGVVYGADPRLVERLLLQAAYESPFALHDPPPEVRFLEFGDNSLDFALFAWCRNAKDRWNFLTHSRYRIIELFERNGVEIPFPQRTLTTAGDKPLKIELLNPPASRRAPEAPAAPSRGTTDPQPAPARHPG